MDINFRTRLGEGEKAGTEAQTHILSEHLMNEDGKHTFQITKRDVLVHYEALNLMEDNKINALLIVDENERLCGALNMHDLLRAGVV